MKALGESGAVFGGQWLSGPGELVERWVDRHMVWGTGTDLEYRSDAGSRGFDPCRAVASVHLSTSVRTRPALSVGDRRDEVRDPAGWTGAAGDVARGGGVSLATEPQEAGAEDPVAPRRASE